MTDFGFLTEQLNQVLDVLPDALSLEEFSDEYVMYQLILLCLDICYKHER